MTNADRRTPYEHEAPPRMDAVIAEARSPAHVCECPYIKPLADALEAALAQVARLTSGMFAISLECTALTPNQRRIYEVSRDFTDSRGLSRWPDDLLAAVRVLDDACHSGPDARLYTTACTTLRRYGLIEEAR